MNKNTTIKIKICKECNSKFEITNKDIEFYNKISPVFNEKKYQIPTPKLCPDCRQQKRLSFRNIRKLYKNKSSLSQKDILSMSTPDSDFKVYSPDEWFSDAYNPLFYWKEINFGKSFYSQFKKLFLEVPIVSQSLDLATIENSDYVNWASLVKNCYLSYNLVDSENIFYSEAISSSKNIVDCFNIEDSENSYECINSNNINTCFYCNHLSSSNNSYFCTNSIWLSNCIWCTNLVNKSYCIFNKQYTKKEYDIKKQEWLKDIIRLKKISNEFIKTQFTKQNFNLNATQSDWEYLINTKNCNNCYYCTNSEDLKHCFYIKNWCENSYDLSIFWNTISNSLELAMSWREVSNCLFCYWVFINVSNLIYCYYCSNWTKNCFWCVWLKWWEYCIFNKQYSMEEYNKLVPKIIKHMQKTWEWWEFFANDLSIYWYNDSTAQEYFPLSKKEATYKWFNWNDYKPDLPKVSKIIKAKDLLKDINKIPDDILNRAIECEKSKRPFKIIIQELNFYRKYNLQVPTFHPDVRQENRLKSVNLLQKYETTCYKCWKKIITNNNPQINEKIYCEDCYNRDVF